MKLEEKALPSQGSTVVGLIVAEPGEDIDVATLYPTKGRPLCCGQASG